MLTKCTSFVEYIQYDFGRDERWHSTFATQVDHSKY